VKKIVTLALALSATAPAFAASSADHTVTVTVAAINEVAITGGNVSLTIDSGSVSGPASASDDTTADLSWSTNEASKKITVATSLEAPKYTLTVAAQNVTGGTSTGSVTLSTTPQDLVTGISNTAGTADLAYQATATNDAGTGSDVHTVTYTITADGV
jgi:hypothetical protein